MRHDLDILYVEDNPADVLLMREALRECGSNYRLNIVNDGEEALDYLHRRGKYSGSPVPDLIILDLNLPRKSGRDVLREVKQNPTTRCIPVVVFSSSGAQHEIREAYDLHANGYVLKPLQLNDIFETIRNISSFWLHTVRLPIEPAGRLV